MEAPAFSRRAESWTGPPPVLENIVLRRSSRFAGNGFRGYTRTQLNCVDYLPPFDLLLNHAQANKAGRGRTGRGKVPDGDQVELRVQRGNVDFQYMSAV